jgi:hypothetical protein
MKFLIITFFLFCLGLNTVQAKEIYKWLDIEGIKQFSNKPPPASCQTSSCIKLNKQISKKLQRKKEAELGRLEAERIQQQESLQKRKQHRETIKLTPATDLSQKTFLPLATVLCVSHNNIKEFKQVRQARKYLERDQVCTKTNEETEYTIIERQDDFSNIRIYLADGSSQKKWVESRYLLDTKN